MKWERSPWVVRSGSSYLNLINLLHCCRDSNCFPTFRNWLSARLLFFHRINPNLQFIDDISFDGYVSLIPLRILIILCISEIWGRRTQVSAEWCVKLLLFRVVDLGKVYVVLVHQEPWERSTPGRAQWVLLRNKRKRERPGAPFLFNYLMVQSSCCSVDFYTSASKSSRRN